MSVLSRSMAVILIAALCGALSAFTPVFVRAINAPVAVNDTFNGTEGMALSVLLPGVLGNDDDGDGGLGMITTVTLVDAPSVPGLFSLGNDGSVTFTPTDPDFNGTATFTYTITDNEPVPFTSAPATVTLNFAPVNDAPTAIDQTMTTGIDTASSSVLVKNDIDAVNVFTFATSSNPQHGVITLDPSTGNFTFTPDVSYVGTDSFTWQVSDGAASSSDATVHITVLPAPLIGITAMFINDNSGSATTTTLFFDGATSTGATTSVSVGAHIVGGATIAGYTRVFSGDCAANGSVTLNFGQSASCIVIYNDDASGGGVPAEGTEEKKPANGPISTLGSSFGTITNFSGSVLGASTTTLPELPVGCTPLISSFMRGFNFSNNMDDVKKLQQFLNGKLGLNLPIDGVFGTTTEEAVKQFQKSNAGNVLAPWGISSPTGFVYLTTQRWINLMSCSTLVIPMPKLVPYIAH